MVILLTDGVNNRGEIAPLTAAEIAKAQGIRVYTIGVGTRGMAPYPAADIYGNPTGGTVMAKVEIDEKTLASIAELTGGRYFRATDKATLKAIYDEINQLEKQGRSDRTRCLPRAFRPVASVGRRAAGRRIPARDARFQTHSLKPCSDSPTPIPLAPGRRPRIRRALLAGGPQPHRRRLARFGCEATLRELMPEVSSGRIALKFILFCTAFALLALAAARPHSSSPSSAKRRRRASK